MHWLALPEPNPELSLAFVDLPSAKAWLATQPQAQPMQMLSTLCAQVEALEAVRLAPEISLSLLNLLRTASIAPLHAVESRYLRKPLPMAEDDQRCFEAAQRLWCHLGLAYLRLTPQLAVDEQVLPLNRAASAIRSAQYVHFQAAVACPPLLDQLLFAILHQAENDAALRSAIPDPDFKQYGESSVSGHVAWAVMLRLVDPYHLSAAQLIVANRALRRWRELAIFQALPDDDPRAHSVDLEPLFGGPLPAGIPRWLEMKKVTRKIDQRIEALQAGEPPEALKLGRELSGAACIRLLRDIEGGLERQLHHPSTEVGEIELAFGSENAYAVLTGEAFHGGQELAASSTSLSHQRMAMFGFDRVSTLPTAIKRLNVPSETWSWVDGRILRALDQAGSRRLAPCLLASRRDQGPCLGVLAGLQVTPSGALSATVRWFTERVEAGRITLPGRRERGAASMPAFLLREAESFSLLVPPTPALTLDSTVTIAGVSVSQLRLLAVRERGVDFVCYGAELVAI